MADRHLSRMAPHRVSTHAPSAQQCSLHLMIVSHMQTALFAFIGLSHTQSPLELMGRTQSACQLSIQPLPLFLANFLQELLSSGKDPTSTPPTPARLWKDRKLQKKVPGCDFHL